MTVARHHSTGKAWRPPHTEMQEGFIAQIQVIIFFNLHYTCDDHAYIFYNLNHIVIIKYDIRWEYICINRAFNDCAIGLNYLHT